MTDVEKPASKFTFFVFVIESPSAVDLYHRRSEATVLSQAISLNRIACEIRLAVNREAFDAALRIGLSDAMRGNPGLIPLLHISAHGSGEGIQLSSGELISWADLRQLLLPVNKALHGALLVCMSTCEGFAGQRMAMVVDSEEHPFYAIVGNSSTPTWSETAVGFATFYHLMANGHEINGAVAAMQIASGNKFFFATTAEISKRDYIEYIKNLNASNVQTELEQQVPASGGNDLEKKITDDRQR